jgi:chaperonin GroEL
MAIQFGSPKIVKKLSFKQEAKDGLISGINKLAEAVGSTLGASGRTVVLEDDFGSPHVTKDGVTVANYINLEDPVENLGVTMLKQASRQTASKAGDGTTTSTVLAQSIIKNYFDKDAESYSFRDVKNGMVAFTKHAVDVLTKKGVAVDDKRLNHVSRISANNDPVLGDFIAEAFKLAGENGVVTMETSPTNETYIESVDGTHIKSTSKSMHFHTNREKEISELEKPLVFLCSSEVSNIRRIQTILEFAIKSNRSLLLIAPCDQQVVSALAMNHVKGNIKCNIIDPPSFGLKRKDVLDDIALLTGATVIDENLGDSLDNITPEVLGSADKAIIDNDGTTLAIAEAPDGVNERVEYLQSQLAEEDHHVMRPHIESRLAILNGGVSIVYVGGDTEVEVSEKKDRVDDAIHAVRAAKKEGILPGGGAALCFLASTLNVSAKNEGEQLGIDIMKKSFHSPFVKILTNAGLDPSDFKDLSKWGMGVDVTDGKIKDMRKAGIIDPVLVTKSALQNAVSVATTILSTDCVISNMRENEGNR